MHKIAIAARVYLIPILFIINFIYYSNIQNYGLINLLIQESFAKFKTGQFGLEMLRLDDGRTQN